MFTAAALASKLRHCSSRRRAFDRWVNYYDDGASALQSLADIYSARKGTKFQNLHYCYSRWPEIFSQYEAVMVMDDDIIIGADGLTRLFDVRRELDLWALQPAFRISGKLSWDVTRVRPTTRLRYTDFIALTCPLFRRDEIAAFMAVYYPQSIVTARTGGFCVHWVPIAACTSRSSTKSRASIRTITPRADGRWIGSPATSSARQCGKERKRATPRRATDPQRIRENREARARRVARYCAAAARNGLRRW